MDEVRKHDPVGRCIYCPRTMQLSKEHIIPSGLGGLEFLPKASCSKCAEKTGSDEQACLRSMLWDIRARLGMRSAYKHKDYPEKFPSHVIGKDGQKLVHTIEPEHMPLAFMLPKLDPPGIVLGLKPSEEIEFHPWLWMEESMKGKWEALDGKGFFPRPLQPLRFCRMLAKIAHAKAVAELKVDGFEHLLHRFIRRKNPHASYYVGCPAGPVPDAEPKTTHRLHLEEISTSDGRTYLTANIRLFGMLGAPVYQVVFATGSIPASFKTASAQ